MIAFFVCTLTVHPARGTWGPKIVHLVLQSRGSLSRHAYKIISGNSAKPVAVGFIELTNAEYSAGQGVAGEWLYEIAGWRSKLVSDIPLAFRQSFNAMLQDRDISPGIVLADSIPQAFDKLIRAIPGTPSTLDDLVAFYKYKTGTDL